MLSVLPVAVIVQWLGERLLDGTWLAAVAWLATSTVLKRASGRSLALLWLGVLISFVVARPFTLDALPLPVGAQRFALKPEASLENWLFSVYAATVSMLFGRLCLCHWRLRRRINGYDVADHTTQLYVAAVARTLALSRLPEVRVADAAIGPFTFGPLRPTLVLPRWLCVPGAQLDAVLLHELSHLTRRDHCWIWLQRAVTVLYFFWPPIYWVSRKLEDARELACDEQAIRAGSLEAAQYSANLLHVVAAKRDARALASSLEGLAALALGPNARRLEWRLNRLLDSTTLQHPLMLERACFLLMAACFLLTFRPTHASTLALLTTTLPTTADVNPQTSQEDSADGVSMCLPPAPNAPCVLQGCGTQCAP